MKWNHNGIMYRRGCYECLIAQYDGKGPWYANDCLMTQQTMKSSFKRLGEHLGAQSIEVKPLYDEDDKPTEKTVCAFMRMYDGTYRFREDTEI